jgi:hypothetical protein
MNVHVVKEEIINVIPTIIVLMVVSTVIMVINAQESVWKIVKLVSMVMYV